MSSVTQESLEALVQHWTQGVLALNTRKSYGHDWRLFSDWCKERCCAFLPAATATVLIYLADQLSGGHKVSTAVRRATSIAHYHREAGMESPCDKTVWALLSGAKRDRCERPVQKRPVTIPDLKAMIRAVDGSAVIKARNRAILLMGFATALRRSNIAGLDLADAAIDDRGMLLTIRREKWDRSGEGRTVAVPRGRVSEICAVRAIELWIKKRGKAPGALFWDARTCRRIHPNRVCVIVQEAAERIGRDPHEYGAHSLRAGFCTEALAKGVGEIRVANQTGHRSLTSLRQYYRPDPFKGHPCSALGL